jgi:hypothetical protein
MTLQRLLKFLMDLQLGVESLKNWFEIEFDSRTFCDRNIKS